MIDKLLNKKYEMIIKDNYIDLKYYKRIVDIDNNKIIILLDNSTLIINGCNLYIKAMDEYEIVIKGVISSIQFINE